MGRNGTYEARGTRVLAGGALAGALLLGAAACGGSGGGTGGQAAGGSASPRHSMAHEHAMTGTVGSDCGMIPASGMGSLHGMKMDQVVTAASHNPLLSEFAAGAKSAGLSSELDSMHAVTVFAPENAAFRKLPDAEMIMHSRKELARVLKNHIVDGRVTPSKLASGMALTTLAGGTLRPARMGSVYEVGKAHVICGNIQTANATVYILDAVLTPKH